MKKTIKNVIIRKAQTAWETDQEELIRYANDPETFNRRIKTVGDLAVFIHSLDDSEMEEFCETFNIDIPETIYETGATSHAVNDLILFTDNTRELAQLRDEIYKQTKARPVNFTRLLYAAIKAYKHEFRHDPDSYAHIINLTASERDEYCRLYADDFENWKKEHDLLSNMQTNKGQTIKEGQRVIARDPQGKLSPGEYTGYSRITGMHHVSFYNGYTGKFKDLKDIHPG